MMPLIQALLVLLTSAFLLPAIGYPLVPALFVLATLVVVANSLYAQFWSTAASILITLAGVPLYFLWQHWQRRRAG